MSPCSFGCHGGCRHGIMSDTVSRILRKPSNQSHPCLLSSCLPSTPSLKGNHKIQYTNRKTSFFKLKIARVHSLRLHGHQSGVPPKDSLMCHFAEKTNNCFFFALRYLINWIGLSCRDNGKTTLFFNNFISNLTKSLYKARTR